MKCAENSTCWKEFGVLDPQARGFCLGPVTKGWFQALSFLFFLAGSCGNLTVIIVLLKAFQDLSSTDLFIIGLAFLDLFSSVFLPLNNFLELTNSFGTQTDHSCRFLSLMYEVCITMSVYVLLFTVYSFYRITARRQPDDKRKIRFVGLFFIAFVLAVVPAFPFASGVHSVNGVCHVVIGSYTSFVLYAVVLFMIEVIFPILIFTIMFTRIGVEVDTDMDTVVSLTERASRKRKSMLLLLIVSTFYLVYLPYIFAILWFMMDWGSTVLTTYECSLFDTFHLFVCCKCFTNPIIYYFYYEGFKENVKRVLCGCKIGRSYKFINARYYFRRDHQESLVEQDNPNSEDHNLREMQDWVPSRSTPVPKRDSELDDKDHDYDEEGEDDNVAILNPFRHLKSTSSF